jgi:hypothetical protein
VVVLEAVIAEEAVAVSTIVTKKDQTVLERRKPMVIVQQELRIVVRENVARMVTVLHALKEVLVNVVRMVIVLLVQKVVLENVVHLVIDQLVQIQVLALEKRNRMVIVLIALQDLLKVAKSELTRQERMVIAQESQGFLRSQLERANLVVSNKF